MTQPSLDLDLDDREPTYTVGELAEAINASLRRRFDDGVWVRGEIQGWSKSAAGHIYFNLVEVDDDGEARAGQRRGAKATVRVAFFAGVQHGPREKFRRANLKLGDGLKVRIFGGLDFFAGSGNLTFKMTDIDVRFTLGDMLQARAEVIRRLVVTGLYDANRTLAAPAVPLRVGVVTSIGSAAWADFTDELRRSEFGFRLRAIDARVQGDGAVPMVAAAITHLGACDDLDVVVVLRGGGSRTDLAVFDHESIAEAIGRSSLPVFTGLGHEIDRSVADEVAHTALKTPTACANELINAVRLFITQADYAFAEICRRSGEVVSEATIDLARVATAIRSRTRSAVDVGATRLDARRDRLVAAARHSVASHTHRVDGAAVALTRTPAKLAAEVRHVDGLEQRLRALDPAVTMARGWTITRDAAGRAIRSTAQLAPGDTITTLFADGSAVSTIEETR